MMSVRLYTEMCKNAKHLSLLNSALAFKKENSILCVKELFFFFWDSSLSDFEI